jgi:hypothetical protein
MRPLHILVILFLAIGAIRMLDYADGWQFPQPEATHRTTAEYLMKDGKTQPSHNYVLAPGQSDAKVWTAALHVSCEALSGGMKCR